MKQQIIIFINKYKVPLSILLAFLIWMLFFDEYKLSRVRSDEKKLEALKKEREYLRNKIENDREQLYILQNDPDELERFAREKFLLKKDDEDVFVIIEEE